ncbi:helix-turn-helix domain-containing protein [Haloarchaeobius sp. DFWS5]|uniref:helix-turn-helix domain-containing protein n=1 Tax=Haloarchaeobius sp. DFWS5 TaxID=3446114 RepID=UPI003EBCB9CE
MNAVGLKLRPVDGAFPGVDEALAAIPGVSREGILNLEWLADGSYGLLYRVTGGDEADIRAVLADHPEVRQHDVVGAEDESHDGTGASHYVFVNVAEREPVSALLAIVDEHRLLLDPPFRFTEDGISVTVAGDAEALQAAFGAATETDVPVEVEWTGGFHPEEPSALARLTDRQREALEAAHALGFYENPRKVSFEDIGAALDCAPSTANELLRRAEAAVMSAVLER